ncbi:transcriptional regulator, RpiR family [Amphibacillus marinus]|uniref:Transcriptional regulator, RpiR family n=1 Tax=Amphibacillus marinus TaxID=872970 RepID=A0A1H8L3H8_9BACI|nr:MurR/RpiR family transcriptional regulator [Amphibacillus marinus]SEN99677.1 transcriptional regulator, RpiR family [Amphibacillus marinus]
MDLTKIVEGKKLNETELTILTYIVDHIDTVLDQGVRTVAKENYTSPSAVMRLSKKLGYNGFVDMYYQLLPLVKRPDQDEEIRHEANPLHDYHRFNDPSAIDDFVEILSANVDRYIFLYATGFSGIIGEYMYKKFLVNGRRVLFASGQDSVGILENNINHTGVFIALTKSGETKNIIEKISYCKAKSIPVVVFTNEIDNSCSKLADIVFRIHDPEKLDDRHMQSNYFFAETMLLFEYIMSFI